VTCWLSNDDEGTTIEAARLLRPVFCLRGGERFAADAAILPVPRAA
jgi:dihydroorotase